MHKMYFSILLFQSFSLSKIKYSCVQKHLKKRPSPLCIAKYTIYDLGGTSNDSNKAVALHDLTYMVFEVH